MLDNIFFRFYSYYSYHRKKMLSKYYTDLVNRRARVVGIDLRVNGEIQVNKFSGLVIGQNVHIGAGAHLDCRGGLFIGNHTHVSRNLTVFSVNHDYEGDLIPYDDALIAKPVIIEDGVWIGMNVNILPGVIIGKGAIVSMGTTITKDVLPYSIVGSSKQSILGYRNKQDYDKKVADKKVSTSSGKFYRGDLVGSTEIVFVVSTGRSGSMSIVDSFKPYSDILGFHEPFYALFRYYSTEYIAGKISEEEAKRVITIIWSIFKTQGKKILLISDQKIVPFIKIFCEIEPKAKWIWLIREPVSFVHSAASRGWFDQDEPKFHKERIVLQEKFYSDGVRVTGPMSGEVSKDQWDEMSQVDRILWYWIYWNSLIQNSLSLINEKQTMVLPLSEFSDKKEIVAKFIGVDEVNRDLKISRSNSVKKTHQNKYNAGRQTRTQEMHQLDRYSYSIEQYKVWCEK